MSSGYARVFKAAMSAPF
jgi:hypothetical protein